MPNPTQKDDELTDLVARCVVAYERDGTSAVDVEIGKAPQFAATVRQQLEALGRAGLLVPPTLPASIDRYRVLQRLGTGGMGSVFLCEQDQPIRRRVAVKVIRPGMNSGDVLRRFRLEQQALAMLQHPHIARVYDAGVTAEGQPFLVMEYVPGQPITRYCDERQLGLRDRLLLFAKVCDAVQHAHHKGILHRDLKPSNVLVADRDGAPFPVVIDFGVAKSVGGALDGAMLVTLPGRMLGTPEYMSPEQATNEQDVDTRTDVYSLGVILYELLTGTLPIGSARFQRVDDVARVLREVEPQTPSTRLTGLGAEMQGIAANRRTDATVLRRSIRGDLDWIVLKALEKDRNRRYGMPAELAADLQRYLALEPILAGRPSSFHRLRKFCARHRLQVGAAVLVFAALTVGLFTSLAFYSDAAAAELRSRAIADRLHQSLETTLAALDRIVTLGAEGLRVIPQSEGLRSELLRSALELHERLISEGHADDPRLAASMALTLARAANLHFLLGEPVEAGQLSLQAQAIVGGMGIADEERLDILLPVAQAAFLCGEVRVRLGDPLAARSLARVSRSAYEAVLQHAPDNRAARFGRLLTLRALADRETATSVEAARALLQEARPLAEVFLAEPASSREERVGSLQALVRLAWLRVETGDTQDALLLFRQVHEATHVSLARTSDLPGRLDLVPVLNQQTSTGLRLGEFDAARKDATCAVEILRAARRAHPDLAPLRGDLAQALAMFLLLEDDRRPPAEIEAFEREALALEEDCYESSGRSSERGDRTICALVGYAARKVDWLAMDDQHRGAVDLEFVKRAMQRAGEIRATLAPATLADRHFRETWLYSFVVRAGLLRHLGELIAARRELEAGLLFAAGLVADHPDVVQVRKVSSEVMLDLVEVLCACGEQAEAWRRFAAASVELLAARPGAPDATMFWARVRPGYVRAAAGLPTTPPDDLGPEVLAHVANDAAECLATAGPDGEAGKSMLRSLGRGALAAAIARGSRARLEDAAFKPLQQVPGGQSR